LNFSKIRKSSIGSLRKVLIKLTHKISETVPRFNLEEKNIQNTKFLLNRTVLLQSLPKNAIVAELGVDQGDFSAEILKFCEPKKLHLIDFWGSKRYNQIKQKSVEKRFEDELKRGQLEINLGFSIEVVKQFPDNYFDWIYIDTDHSYKTTKAELDLYAPKMKSGGVIAGHDFIVANWYGLVKYGVIEAVYEFCLQNNWEIIYITAENKGFPSFAIRKIGA